MVQLLSINFFLGFLKFLLGFSKVPVFFVSPCTQKCACSDKVNYLTDLQITAWLLDTTIHSGQPCFLTQCNCNSSVTGPHNGTYYCDSSQEYDTLSLGQWFLTFRMNVVPSPFATSWPLMMKALRPFETSGIADPSTVDLIRRHHQRAHLKFRFILQSSASLQDTERLPINQHRVLFNNFRHAMFLTTTLGVADFLLADSSQLLSLHRENVGGNCRLDVRGAEVWLPSG